VTRNRLFLIIALIAAGGALVATLFHFTEPPTQAKPKPSPTLPNAYPSTLSHFYKQNLVWKGCGDGFDCTKLEVPLDYRKPAAASIYLKVTRHKAPAEISRGSLVINPGGPGGSGVDFVRSIDYIMTPTLKANFDVVGFDPRGVGTSNPVKCLNDKQLDQVLAADQSPDNSAEVAQFVAYAKLMANECAKKSPEIYKFMDTVSAARDIDILRQALGNEKLNWFGWSYGTFLGATYADLFPKNVGRMTLDGAIDPKLTNEQMSYGQAVGFDVALRRFVADCAAQSDCPLSHNTDTGVSQVANMLDNLDSHPGKLQDGRQFTQAMALTGVLGNLYSKQYGWPDLRSALLTALDGDYETLAASADFYTSRDSNGHYTDNGNEAIYAVNCLDRPDRATLAQTQQLANKWSKQAPLFGISLAWSNLGCTYWQAPATGAPGAIHAKGSPKILVVGTKYDPATPYAWAKSLASQLSQGVLLTFNGDGHTAYNEGSDCIDRYIDQYFLIGRAPTGVTCNYNP
jgi:pimeloyl-ACP methyl ester carboxylesterase